MFESSTGYKILRGRAVVARKAHNLEVVGSSPAPATKKKFEKISKLFRIVGYKVSSLKNRFSFKRRKLINDSRHEVSHIKP